MKSDQYGRIALNEKEAFSALYSGKITDFKDIYLEDPSVVSQFIHSKSLLGDRFPTPQILEELNLTKEEFDKQNQNQWFMPEDYFPNLVEFLYNKCQTSQQKDRVSQELELYIQYGLIDLLHYLKYLVDTMRENNIVWGVGRGSSVASYVLFLLGIHKVDSIKYDLDIHEFLK